MLTKEAELFEKANIVDIGLQPNEFSPRRRGSSYSGGSPRLEHGLNHLSIDNQPGYDVNDGGSTENLHIDEVDEVDEAGKVDNNIMVDETFQKYLNDRADQFHEGNSINSGSFPPIPKPKVEFNYKDDASLRNDVDYWFTANEVGKLAEYPTAFFNKFGHNDFRSLKTEDKEDIVQDLMDCNCSPQQQLANLKNILYLALGCYTSERPYHTQSLKIVHNVKELVNLNVIPWVTSNLREKFEAASTVRYNLEIVSSSLFHCLSILHICTLVGLQETECEILKRQLIDADILNLLTRYIDTWKWNARNSMRIRNIVILLSKTIHLIFGDLTHRETAKKYLLQKYNLTKETDPNKLTASPVDFHVYRQELTTRYPSFIPPPSTLPVGFEDSSSLAQFITVQRSQSRSFPNNNPPPSIHIATPAPSPSSSPVNRGPKAKRVFQTNQNYPFIHPVDGFEGYVPKSIQEATDLFQSRVRNSLHLKQLWCEIDNFVKQERGWSEEITTTDSFDYSSDFDNDFTSSIESLNLIEDYYSASLPYLSSLVHVLLQVIVSSQDSINLPMDEDINFELAKSKFAVLKESSYILLSLLKWFKINHILKYENLCCLIYDSNFFAIVGGLLEKFETNLLERIQNTKLRDSTVSFWKFEEDPNIIDKDFCFMLFNLITVSSKVLSSKTQRILTLCEKDFTSSLRPVFSFYNPDLWHPALKIIKEITPFNGKKWKSDNMDLISLVYLHGKLNLRDNWLSGRDITSEIDDGYGQELALRALVQFYNVRKYKDAMVQLGYEKGNSSFFSRETDLLNAD